MLNWQLWLIVGLVLCLLEVFTPTLFFLNLGLAAFISAIFAFFGANFAVQSIVFVIVSALCIAFLRPVFVKNQEAPKDEFKEKYTGKTARVIEEVSVGIGRIEVFGEKWLARSLNGEVYAIGDVVKIVKNESNIMFVDKDKEN